jgi:DNA polymerase V
MALFDKNVNPKLLVRRINLTANHVLPEAYLLKKKRDPIQLDLFTDYETLRKKEEEETAELEKERRVQLALLSIKQKYGKNSVLRGLNLKEGATAKDRNEQIGGHKA